jgi:hypothetical protein
VSQGETSSEADKKPAEGAPAEKPADAAAAAGAAPGAAPAEGAPAEAKAGDAKTAEGEAAEPAKPKGDRSTHFIFEHKVFAIPGARFLMAPDTHRPVYSVPLGALKGMMDLQLVRSSFSIKAGSPDDEVLTVVGKSLKYVKDIRPGDTIPNELLDGSASWSVSDQHRMIAKNRLMLQLASWVTGRETVVTDMEHLQQVVEDPAMKKNISDGIAKMAGQLGLPEEKKEEVLDRIDKLARELCYIEALRSRLNELKLIPLKLREIEHYFRRNKTLGQEVQQIIRLIRPPLQAYSGHFDQVDAQTGEIVAALKNLDNQINYVRESRDELHQKFMVWDKMHEKWREVVIEVGEEPLELIHETYRFAAHNFLQPKSWQLNITTGIPGAKPGAPGAKPKEKAKIKIEGKARL